MYKEVGYFDKDYNLIKRLSYCKDVLISIREYNTKDGILSKKTEYVDDKIIVIKYNECSTVIEVKETFKNNELVEKTFFSNTSHIKLTFKDNILRVISDHDNNVGILNKTTNGFRWSSSRAKMKFENIIKEYV